MRLSSSFVFAALLAAALPARADVSVASPGVGGKARVLATLERTACFGTCPVYRVTVYSDGRVEWEGREFVKVRGKAAGRLDAAGLRKLREAFAAARYFDLRGEFDCREVTDNPSANTSFSDGTRSRAIRHYYGCSSPAGAAALTTLESRIDEIVGSARWVGRPR